MVLHITAADLDPHVRGVARHPALGPILLDRITDWLRTTGGQSSSHVKVTVRPVIDPDLLPAIDTHDPTDAIALAVRTRDKHCVYPNCGIPSERCDLDHIDPYIPLDRGGPPGQTSVAALAPLCRRHHRAKTHGLFTYRRLPDGTYHWQLPTGDTEDTT